MSGKTLALVAILFFVLLACFVGGIEDPPEVEYACCVSNIQKSGFRWLNAAIILVAASAFSCYWLYAQRTEVASAKTRFRGSFAFHLGAFGLTLLSVGIYALFDKPVDYGWLMLMLGWGIVVITHGLLTRRIQDAPEDIFV